MIRSMDVKYDVTQQPLSIEVVATHVPTGYAVTAVGQKAKGWTTKKLQAEAFDSLNSILTDA